MRARNVVILDGSAHGYFFVIGVGKFSEIVKIESSLRVVDPSRQGGGMHAHTLRFPGIRLQLMCLRAACPIARLAQCARVRRDSVLNKFSVQQCRAGRCPRPICAPTSSPPVFRSPFLPRRAFQHTRRRLSSTRRNKGGSEFEIAAEFHVEIIRLIFPNVRARAHTRACPRI